MGLVLPCISVSKLSDGVHVLCYISRRHFLLKNMLDNCQNDIGRADPVLRK